jgi:hypothetical protein
VLRSSSEEEYSEEEYRTIANVTFVII